MSERVLDLPAHVASVAPRDLAEARRLSALVPSGATAIEYRLDLAFEPIAPAALLELDPRPAILTWRSAREGGRFDGSAEEYRALVLEAYRAGATVDVEHDSGLLAQDGFFPDRRRVIVSAHFPFGLPSDAEATLAAMGAAGTRASKLVAGAADLSAAFAVAALQSRPRDFPASIFPMGPASAPGRVLSAHLGAALVYGSVGTVTARGQLPIAELIAVYGTDRPVVPEALFGIVAADPSGTLSPRVHNALFRARGLRFLYLPLPTSDFDREKPAELAAPTPFRGFSVTRPWKRAAARSGVPSTDVREAGAANTLVRASDGKITAHNTDVPALAEEIALLAPDRSTWPGSRAIVLYGAANRDERKYPDPDRFDVLRRPGDHLVGPGAVGQVDGGVATVFPVRHGHRECSSEDGLLPWCGSAGRVCRAVASPTGEGAGYARQSRARPNASVRALQASPSR